jgi:hypothetical protein
MPGTFIVMILVRSVSIGIADCSQDTGVCAPGRSNRRTWT